MKRHSREAYVNLIAAAIAGLCVGFILAWTRSSGDAFMITSNLRIAITSVLSYSLVALALLLFQRTMKTLSALALIAVVGSVTNFVGINLVSDMKYIWTFRNSSIVGSAHGLIVDELFSLGFSTIMDSIIAIAVMLTLRYMIGRSRIMQLE